MRIGHSTGVGYFTDLLRTGLTVSDEKFDAEQSEREGDPID